MPFTFSHPAAVLPFLKVRRNSISMSALVTGSMIPDFQYFILMKLSGRFSHSFAGIFLFDIPVAIVMLIVFHAWVKGPLIDNLPVYFSGRLQRLKAFDFFRYAREHPPGLILCVLAGTVSHIFWDGFTHKYALFSELIPALHTVISIAGFPDLPLYRFFQHASTVLGAMLIVLTFHQMPVEKTFKNPDLRFWTLLTFFFTLTFIIRGYFGIEYYGDTVAILVSSSLVGLILASAVMRIKWNRL